MVALDTNVVIDHFNNRLPSSDWMRELGNVCLPTPVVGELLFGALNSGRPAFNLARYRNFMAKLVLKKSGHPIPENDLWIAAICHANDVLLLTSDRHFTHIPGLGILTP